ncbi:MAG: hypothetical protein K9G33_12880 [Sneathiella sp.]|nr:hypothetical protein [Sneathiella sp.]
MSISCDNSDLASSVTFTDSERDQVEFPAEKLAEAIGLFNEYGFIRMVMFSPPRRLLILTGIIGAGTAHIFREPESRTSAR